MSLGSYTLTHGTETKALADWGIEEATLKLAVGGDDELRLAMASAITAAPVFTPLAPVVLKDETGTVRFRGIAIPRRDGYRMTWSCLGANYYLNRAYMTGEWKAWDGADFAQVTLARIFLGVDTVAGELASSIAATVDAGAPLTLAGTDLPTYKNPEQIEHSQRVYDAVRSILGWSPHLTWRWNYSSAGAEMRVFSVLRSGHGYGDLSANSIGTKTVALAEMQQAPATVFEPRYDLLYDSLKIYWLGYDAANYGSAGTPILRWTRSVDAATAAPANGTFGGIELFMQLRRDVFNATAIPGDPEDPVANLAQRLGAPYFSLWLDFRFTTMGRVCDFSYEPGQLVSASDADPLYASAQSLCHSVTHDLAHGTTSVECGAPETLGFHDPRLNARLRKAASGADASGRTYGFEKNTEPAGAGRINIVVHERNTSTDALTVKRLAIEAVASNALDGDKKRFWTNVEEGAGIDAQKIEIIGSEVS